MIRRRVGYVLWLLSAAALCFFENNTGTRIVLAGSVLLPVISILCAAYTARHLFCRIDGPDCCRKEDTICTAALSGSRCLAGCVVQIRLRSDNPFAGDSFEQMQINRGGRTDIPVSVPYCGRVRITISELRVMDWFGLCCFPAIMQKKPEHLLMVYPDRSRRGADTEESQLLTVPEKDIRPLEEAGIASDPARIRPYVPGDSARQIHWKLSVKTGELLIREGEDPGEGGLLLLLETSLPALDPAGMDAAANDLLAFSSDLTEKGIPHTVYWYDQRRNELRQSAVRREEEEDYLQEELLKSASAVQGVSTVTVFFRQYPELSKGQILLFGPHAERNEPG